LYSNSSAIEYEKVEEEVKKLVFVFVVCIVFVAGDGGDVVSFVCEVVKLWG
jgi:hypothetical protein